MDQPVYVFGAGGLAGDFTVMVDDVSNRAGPGEDRYDICAYIETSPHSSSFMDKPIISEERFREIAASSASTQLFILIGAPTVRERIVTSLADLPISYPRFVHPSVTVHRTNALADGVIVSQNVIMASHVRIERHSYVNFSAIVGHDVQIGEFSFIGPAACLNGEVEIGRACHVGAASAFRPGVRVGDASVIGMGAVVLRDVPPSTTVVGNPARPLVKG